MDSGKPVGSKVVILLLIAFDFNGFLQTERNYTTEKEPKAKKVKKQESYTYLSKLNERKHQLNNQWMPEKPDFDLLASKYPSFCAL